MLNYTPIGSLRSQNSYTAFLRFTQPAAQNDRLYFTNDSQIDDARVVGIETHAHINIAGVLPYDLPATVEIDAITYNVITQLELVNITLTIVNKKRQQVISNAPFTSFFNYPALPSFLFNTPGGKTYRKFDLDVLSGESYITFNFNSIVATPFVVPITFFFDDKK